MPKIEKKKLRIAADRNKSLKNPRIASSMNSQKLFEAQQADINFKKMTIENQMNEIIDIEERINLNLEKEESDSSGKEEKKKEGNENFDHKSKWKSSDD